MYIKFHKTKRRKNIDQRDIKGDGQEATWNKIYTTNKQTKQKQSKHTIDSNSLPQNNDRGVGGSVFTHFQLLLLCSADWRTSCSSLSSLFFSFFLFICFPFFFISFYCCRCCFSLFKYFVQSISLIKHVRLKWNVSVIVASWTFFYNLLTFINLFTVYHFAEFLIH